jgi:hypothetical protein
MKQSIEKNKASTSRFQKSNVIWSEMSQAEWLRRKCQVPRKFLTAWAKNPGSKEKASHAS